MAGSLGGGRGVTRRFRRAGSVVAAQTAVMLALARPAAATPHVVQPGESLWSIASANGMTVTALASANGISEDAPIIAGSTLEVPAGTGTTSTSSSGASHTVQAGETLSGVAAANGISVESLAAANGLSSDSFLIAGDTITIPAAGTTTTSSATTTSETGIALGDIPSPYGTLHLASGAADSWNSMREASLSTYGVDLYPSGTLGAYRTYDEQAYLYNLYLAGQGAPAYPPGSSPHESGLSVDVATPEMRSVVDSIGSQYCWGKIYGPSEWWHVDYVC